MLLYIAIILTLIALILLMLLYRVTGHYAEHCHRGNQLDRHHNEVLQELQCINRHCAESEQELVAIKYAVRS